MSTPVADWQNGGFGIYVHWPFCAAKCPYCDFNSHVRMSVDTGRWTRALVAEIGRAAAETPGRRVESVFFGGGTPSLMPPDTVAAVIAAIRQGWDLGPDGAVEITLEANPTSVEAHRFRGYRDAGVNRLSMGIQSLDDNDLRALGRRHTVGEALAAFDVARSIFARVSFDLIYARQGQTVAAWERELATALGLAIDHLSLYQLTIEPGTRFGDLAARGRLRDLPTDGIAAEMYAVTQTLCDAAGMPAYEVSNHARAGAGSRHNLVYWRYGDYVGVGPGAHGRITRDGTRWASETIRAPEAWIEAVEREGTGQSLREPVAPADQAIEMLMMGLRLTEGIDAGRYAALAGRPLAAERVAELDALGLLRATGDRLVATADGRRVLDAVLRRLLI
ncbi:MAG: radical SAM family heme chaperone HemW [Amaricoccus sp.]|uniref:radical SAM family heme chaperone HemW n=1 Tax=Amaricoccus sp. TaxID=1872485 RepID=UPI0039E356A2